MNVTLPVGFMPLYTEAVNVTACPTKDGLWDDAFQVAVTAGVCEHFCDHGVTPVAVFQARSIADGGSEAGTSRLGHSCDE